MKINDEYEYEQAELEYSNLTTHPVRMSELNRAMGEYRNGKNSSYSRKMDDDDYTPDVLGLGLTEEETQSYDNSPSIDNSSANDTPQFEGFGGGDMGGGGSGGSYDDSSSQSETSNDISDNDMSDSSSDSSGGDY